MLVNFDWTNLSHPLVLENKDAQKPGGPNGPQQIKNVISLELNVRLTSNQAVNLSFYVVLRPI